MLILPAGATSKAARRNNPPPSDPDYVPALSAANRFLNAWENRDHETVLLMLTDGAKRQVSAERLDDFVAADPDVDKAYEISHGKKLQTGRYTFTVGLFEGGGTAEHKHKHSHYSQIIVTRTGEHDWAIDKLP